MDQSADTIERGSGVAVWRQIADRIRQLASSGELDGTGRLPPEMALAERFGVNRHTVRSAVAQLVQEGVLRTEQGRGTFVERRPRLSYPIARRTRFSEGLAGQAEQRRVILLSHAIEPAGTAAAEALGIEQGAPLVRLDSRSEADGRPVSRATSWFDAARFPDVVDHFVATGSITAALKAMGVDDYVRKTTTITARLADGDDLSVLRLSPGAVVLITEAVNADLDGRPIQYSRTSFAADRVELRIDNSAP
ncbi:MAG: phosphonate metabolism transcriptional regulator PhnF [Rhizobiaceae bacterium]|nr:phosphonate metabolism transcriptional regulator PhnF [Rhizobiaceae bacterium]